MYLIFVCCTSSLISVQAEIIFLQERRVRAKCQQISDERKQCPFRLHHREVEQNSKTCLSSDCRLKLAYMKLELLVIADQNAAVNTFPGLVHTARHTMGVCNTRSLLPNRKEGAAEGGISDWGEVVTR